MSTISSYTKPTIEIPTVTEAVLNAFRVDSPRAFATAPAAPKRCCAEGCKKKLSLTDFPCKCGKIHCPSHRPSELHQCTYNYRDSQTNELRKTLNEVKAEKISKI